MKTIGNNNRIISWGMDIAESKNFRGMHHGSLFQEIAATVVLFATAVLTQHRRDFSGAIYSNYAGLKDAELIRSAENIL